jgi:hypothetical protein
VSANCARAVFFDWQGMDGANKLCDTNAFLIFRDFHGKREFVSKSGRSFNTGGRKCAVQYHARFYDDHKHQEQTGNGHGRQDQWTLVGVHHESRGVKDDDFGHEIDMPWDDVRVHALKNLRERCQVRRWHVHPTAAGKFQGYENSGMISRISLSTRNFGPQPCAPGT